MSLNPIPSVIRYCDLIQQVRWFNLGRKNKLTLNQYIYFKEIDLTEVVNTPVDKLAYYKRFAKGLRVRATVE